ncbi:MAG: IclR family transcriptional regulator [Caldilineaceae bacterium]|nr:IclR family transcriptional regulator [Caldilineaceae bacterium]
MSKNKSVASIQTLSRAMILFDKLYDSAVPLGVNELAKQCDMNLSTAFRILKTLMQGGWVYQCEDDRYIISPRFSFITERTGFYFALKEISAFTMDRITTQETQAMNLSVLKDRTCIILQQSRTTKLMDLIPPVNSTLPFHASASGKIILAGLPDPLLRLYMANMNFESLTKDTITDHAVLTRTLEVVRQDGYALDLYETMENSVCIAAPILRNDGETIAALSFSGIIGAFDQELLNHYLPVLRQAADEISDNLFQTYQGESIYYSNSR